MSPPLGSALRRVFGREKPEPEAVARVKAWARAALAPDDGAAITVNEIACLDPACPGLETVILVMRRGERSRAYKIAGALAEIGPEQVRDALAKAG